MLKFIKERQCGKYIGLREWWSIGKRCEAMISVDDEETGAIWIKDESRKDIVPIVAEKLNIPLYDKKKNIPIRMNASIDSYYIECPVEEVKEMLEKIDRICEDL